ASEERQLDGNSTCGPAVDVRPACERSSNKISGRSWCQLRSCELLHMSDKRVLLLIMPFLTLRRPHLGVALLKAELNALGMQCDVRYFNFRFAEIIGAEVYERIAENSPAHQMPGEFIFTPALYGEHIRPFSDFTHTVAGYIRPYPPELLRQMERARNLSPLFIQECANLIDLPYPDHSDFFRDFEASSIHSLVVTEVTMETSRGCWWGQKHHCTFCG